MTLHFDLATSFNWFIFFCFFCAAISFLSHLLYAATVFFHTRQCNERFNSDFFFLFSCIISGLALTSFYCVSVARSLNVNYNSDFILFHLYIMNCISVLLQCCFELFTWFSRLLFFILQLVLFSFFQLNDNIEQNELEKNLFDDCFLLY